MIKINLLDSVTERKGGAAVAVERKISSPVSRLIVMTIAVVVLLLAVAGGDVISTYLRKMSAERQLAVEKQTQAELQVVLNEQKELQQRIQNIDMRIEAIKKLRASQAGPSAVLDAMVERISMVPGLYLENVEQSGSQLTITGNSPDESQVTQFGRSLEFSGGLFSNLYIETQRKVMGGQQASEDGTVAGAKKQVEIVGFKIKCAYTPEKSGAANDSTTAQNTPPTGAPPAAGAPAQIAKN